MDIKNETEFYRWLGKQYRKMRESAGFKQKDIASKAGISPADLSRFERNGMKLSAFRVALLFREIGIDFEDFVIGYNQKKNSLSRLTAIA